MSNSTLLSDILTDIETDRVWRDEELNFFENQLSNQNDSTNKKMLSKALILLLYSFFEGHVKFIFTSYIGAINRLNLNCSDVITPLVASNLYEIFGEFKSGNSNPKHKIFKHEHPKGFVELGKRIEFLENLENIMSQPIGLNIDKIVDTESNLSKKVLSKILFRIGFDISDFDEKQLGHIEKLLEYRNAIAHGSRKQGWTYSEYMEIKTSIFSVIQIIRTNVISYFSDEKFKKRLLTS